MKKNIIINFILLIVIYLILKNNILISINILSISYIFIYKILPYFISIFIISKLLINYNFIYYVSKLFNNNIYVYVLLISFISGSPNNIYLIKDLLDKNIVSEKDANKLIMSSGFTNPLFLYSMLSSILNNRLAIMIIIIQVISNIIIYLFNRVKINKVIKINSLSFNEVFINSIKDVSNILINIYIVIIVFNIIISLIPINNFIGLIEITKGLDYIRYLDNEFIKVLLSTIYISFGGLSIHMQIKSALSGTDINYNNYLLSRIYQVIISLLTTICAYSSYCYWILCCVS
ncbi:MAG: hypothetical protein E7159_01665 [Firmicutes bacterium]|nr:hypothetical protein [Bacillota bacterium]